LEYEEIISNKTSASVAQNMMNLLGVLKNVEFKQIAFFWNPITADPDDNKFVDCAIAGAADCIVTNDRHFNELAKIAFPQMPVMNADDLLDWCKKSVTAGKN
jgi:uncharacterized protein